MAFPATVLPIRAELDLAGTATYTTDITADVYQRADITINRGRPDEASVIQPSDCSMTLDNRVGNYSLRNPAGAYYGQIGRNTPLRVSVDSAVSWLVINAETGTTPVAGTYVSTPDAAALDLVGDVDLRFDADLDSWSESMELISKWTTTGNQRSYALSLDSTGLLRLWHSTDGTAAGALSSASTVPVPISSGRLAVRAVLDVNDGAGNRVRTFYTSTTGVNGTWTQLGDPVTLAGVTSVFSSSAVLAVLDNPNSDIAGSIIRGKVYAAQVRSVIGGTIVADPDFTLQTEAAASFVDSTGKTWTPNGTVALTKKDVRFIGEVSTWPVAWDVSGRDIYVELSASGIMRRLSQGQSPLRSTLYRGIIAETDLLAYWPMEDGSGATSIAAATPNTRPMTFSGSPTLATHTVFPSTLPIPEFNGALFTATVPAYTTTNKFQVRFLLNIPAAGTTNAAVIARLFTTGTIGRWDLVYGTGGTLQLTSWEADGSAVGTSGAVAFNLNGRPVRVSVEIETTGGNVNWRFTTLELGQTTGGSFNGTEAGRSAPLIQKVQLNVKNFMMDVGIGQLSVQSDIDSIYTLASQLNAFSGEAAGRRFQRLCREEGIEQQSFGDLDDSTAMGVQTALTLLDLLKECAASDLGLLGESKAILGLSYRPRSTLLNQTAALTIPYLSVAQLGPVEDDALVRNDVTTTRQGGSSARYVLETGAMSVLDPPLGVGRYNEDVTISVEADTDLADQAGWRVHVGTVNEARYPAIKVDLARPLITGSASLTAALQVLDLGDRVVVTSPPAGRTAPGDVSQLLQGLTETLNAQAWTMTLKCSPESPWRVAVYGAVTSGDVARYSSDGSTLAATMTTTATSVTVATTTAGKPLWLTTATIPGDFPFDIIVAGEQMTVIAIVGATSPQTFTVTRSVNGIVKTHAIGEAVELFTPAYYAL